MKSSVYGISLFQFVLLFVLAGCGTWVGNPVNPDEDTPVAKGDATVSTGGTKLNNSVGPGEAAFQLVSLKKEEPFVAQYGMTVSSTLGIVDGEEVSGNFEVSVLSKDGLEKVYSRSGVSNTNAKFTPPADGDFLVAIKNNSGATVEIKADSVSGAASAGNIESANSRSDAVFKDYVLKAVIVLARECKKYVNNGASTETHKAPAGEYHVQPFVFFGKVGSDKKVTPISTATIKLTSSGRSISLKKLSDFDLAVYREYGSLTAAQHAAYTRGFFQSYFSAAGEMYTVETFRFGGDCANATTFALPTDVGTGSIELSIEDSTISPAVSTSFKVQPTIRPSFSMYERDGTKQQDWTQCTYNRLTAEPKTYNGSAQECKMLSIANPPYVILDYLLPSATGSGYTSVSDPTRVIFYGHSFAKSWYKALIDNADDLSSGAVDTLTLSRCMNNGGMTAVPLIKGKAYLPLEEFNTAVDDVVNLGQRSGSYTALPQFYQGNVDASGEITFPTCIPRNGETCPAFKLLKVKVEKCSIKADSGISTLSIGDSFLYQEYFDMSGVIDQ